jgi:hypothetical protein
MIVIQDNFYPNPEEIREKALNQFFFPGVKGKKVMFPGQITVSTFSNENFIYVKNRLEKILNRKIIHFPKKNSNTAFTLGLETKNYINWVHHDVAKQTEKVTNDLDGEAWASVLYLTPNAPVTHGTGLFRDKEKKSVERRDDLRISAESFKGFWEQTESSTFEMHTYVGNIYNRLVVYPAAYWHAPFNAGWGHDKKTGRLVQVCFFTTEKE